MNQGSLHKSMALLVFFIVFLAGCSNNQRTSEVLNPTAQIPEPAALLTASREATAIRLMKDALKVDGGQNLCEGSITHSKRLAIKRAKKPQFLKYFLDSTFGTRGIRITDSDKNEVQKPIYSSVQPWNADESLLLLHRVKSGKNDYVLLGGHDYRYIKTLKIQTSNPKELFWSHTNPDTLFYVSIEAGLKGWFMRYNVRSGERRRIRKFDNICGNSIPGSGYNVQMQSLDNDLFGFRCETRSGHAMFSYRVSTNTITPTKIGKGTQWNEDYAPAAAPSGLRMEMQGRVVSPQLSDVLHELDQAVFNEHSSLGRTKAGEDALFQTIFDPSPDGCDGSKHQGVAHLAEFNLETGKCRAVISQADGWPYTTSGTHVSAVARHRPGWVAMSSIGYDDFEHFTGRGQPPPLVSEIYLVNTDPENTKLCRLMQHRSYAKEAINGDYPVELGAPHVTLSPSGTRVLFGSDWYDSGAVDSYVIELPAYTENLEKSTQKTVGAKSVLSDS